MKTYKIRKLISGFKVAPEFKDKILIAFPEKLLRENRQVRIEYDSEFMIISKDEKPLHRLKFHDKFGRNQEYTLIYFEWKPQKQESLF